MKNLIAVVLWLSVVAFSISVKAQPQQGDKILFKVADENVTQSEFVYVYEKNNPGKQNDYSRESLEEYLDLYINFKLKVREARTLQIDTLPSVRSELARYRNQLVKSYFDKEVTEKLMREVYQRMLKEVEVSHIMVQIGKGRNTTDTLEAWKKINDIRNTVMAGKDFAEAARELSHDPMAKENGGYLGYVTGLQVADENFENAVFNTPKGKVSPVVRTNFGYHIIKTGEVRPASGTVTVAHILFRTPTKASEEDFEKAKIQAMEVYGQLKNGASFDSLAAKYSEDKLTANKGGRLSPFGIGKMVASFEKASFALSKDGEYSEPVRTDYGYHIIKRIARKEVGTYEEVKPEINKQLQRTGRYQRYRLDFIESAKKEFNFMEYPDVLNEFKTHVDSSILKNNWAATKAENINRPLFKLGNSLFTEADFADFVEKTQRAYTGREIESKVDRLYNQYVEDNVTEYALGQRYEDFRRLMQEYRDGILLFELTEDMVWSRALQDSIGLQQYYDSHKNDYMWGERTKAYIYECANESIAKKVRKLISKGKSIEEIDKSINSDAENPLLTVDEGIYSAGQNLMVDAVKGKSELGDNSISAEGLVSFVQILERISPSPKSLDEAKGYVISDYQDFLEKEWIRELKKKYTVEIDRGVFNSMVK